ncbi:MAG: hypothetical protein QI223_01240 [Candidatus Korarchaeota archaeon]|nr:hypothetical protein [Candidatus Korarchaeota archaeon]
MEASIEAAVGILLGLVIILVAYTLFFPMIEERQREANFVQARNIALELHDAIESVASAGRGAKTTIRFEVPTEVVVMAGRGAGVNKSIWVILKNPPEFSGSVILATGAVSVVNQTVEGSQLVFKVEAVGGWNLTLSGAVPSGTDVPLVVENAGSKTIRVVVGG